ncbi:MAG: hypothetical protein R2844_13490 [Caldilineales bacterium]
MHRRFPFFVLILIVVIGLFVVGGQSGRQDAWTQGYLTGLAAAGGQDGAAIPYALAMQNRSSGPGFFGVILGFGLLALLFMAVMRGMRYWMWQSAGGPGGEEGYRSRQRHGPWRGCWPERSYPRDDRSEQPARQPMPAEPVETKQPATTD